MAEQLVNWRKDQQRRLAEMTGAEREEYTAAWEVVGMRMHLAELVYTARVDAGLGQAELAKRAGTKQSAISAIERAGQVPGGLMLERIAEALGLELTFSPVSERRRLQAVL